MILSHKKILDRSTTADVRKLSHGDTMKYERIENLNKENLVEENDATDYMLWYNTYQIRI